MNAVLELDTVDKIAKDIFKKVDEDTLMRIANPQLHGTDYIGRITRLEFESAVKRWIRNYYRLWGKSALTRKWHKNSDSRLIVDGIDNSPDHPDNISEIIYQRVKELYENGYCRQSDN